MKLLVSGCGRSGTKWMSEVLTKAGVPCSHEEAFTPERHGTGEWADWTAEASWCAAPFTPIENVYVVHLVRHPLDVLRSRIDKGTFDIRWNDKRGKPYLGPWADWACRWCPGMDLTGPALDAAAIHWVQWNRLVVANERLRLEDVDIPTINRLARIVDPQAPGIVKPVPLPATNTTPDDKRSPIPRWADVVHVPGFMAMAESYGYR